MTDATKIKADFIREFNNFMKDVHFYNWGNNIYKDYKYRKFSNYFYNKYDWEITEQQVNIF